MTRVYMYFNLQLMTICAIVKRNLQWLNPHWSIPVNEQVAFWTEQVTLP